MPSNVMATLKCSSGVPQTFIVRAKIVSGDASPQSVARSAVETATQASTLSLEIMLLATEASARRITGDLQVSLQRPAS